MFSTIIVAHDHLAGGRDALALGRLLARTTGARLVAAGVIPVGLMPAQSQVVWREEEHAFSEKIREQAATADGEARVFHSHSVSRGLSDLAEEIDADLIVVGSSRRGKIGQVLAGNTALQVLHGARCPVGVAPMGYETEAPEALDSIVVGVDGAPEARAAARAAAELAAAADAELELVAVAEPPPVVHGKGTGMTGYRELEEAIKEHLQADLEKAVAELPEGSRPNARLLEGDVVKVLEQVAADASLLAVGSRGHGPVGRVLLGSTDAKLLGLAPCPLLVWPRHAR